jgi:hypothetical protein
LNRPRDFTGMARGTPLRIAATPGQRKAAPANAGVAFRVLKVL